MHFELTKVQILHYYKHEGANTDEKNPFCLKPLNGIIVLGGNKKC